MTVSPTGWLQRKVLVVFPSLSSEISLDVDKVVERDCLSLLSSCPLLFFPPKYLEERNVQVWLAEQLQRKRNWGVVHEFEGKRLRAKGMTGLEQQEDRAQSVSSLPRVVADASLCSSRTKVLIVFTWHPMHLHCILHLRTWIHFSLHPSLVWPFLSTKLLQSSWLIFTSQTSFIRENQSGLIVHTI